MSSETGTSENNGHVRGLAAIFPVEIFSLTWESFFYEAMNTALVRYEPYLHASTQYVQGVIEKRNQLFAANINGYVDISEITLTKNCLGRLTLAGNYILEDTTNGISDFRAGGTWVQDRERREAIYLTDEVADNFRKQTFFGSTEPASPRVDIMVRLPCGHQENRILQNSHRNGRMFTDVIPYYAPITRSRAPPIVQSPSYRVMSWNHIAWINLKRPEEELKRKYIQQACYNCESVLRVSPNRRCVFAALTNLRSIIFVCSKVVEVLENGKRKFENYFSSSIGDIGSEDRLIAEFSSFLITSSESFGATQFHFPLELFTPTAALGHGSSSSVLRGNLTFNGQNDVVALKISPNPHCITVERFFLTRLQTLYPDRSEFPRELVLHSPEATSLDHTHCELFTECYETIHNFGQEEVILVWNALALAHAAGIAHCDIRINNCMQSLNGNNVVLIDWSSSRPLHPPQFPALFQFQPPTKVTASRAVLDQFHSNNFQVYAADEAYSVILMAFHIKFPTRSEIRTAFGDVDCTRLVWNKFFDVLRKVAEIWDNNPMNQANQVALIDSVMDNLEYLHNNRTTFNGELLNELVMTSVYSIFQLSIIVPATVH
jgi:hypothetical protein